MFAWLDPPGLPCPRLDLVIKVYHRRYAIICGFDPVHSSFEAQMIGVNDLAKDTLNLTAACLRLTEYHNNPNV
jgi:hypothetical protein